MNDPINNDNQAPYQLLDSMVKQLHEEQRRNRTWKNIWRLIWLGVLLLIIAASFASCNQNSKPAATGEHTALINLSGEIGRDEFNDPVAKLLTGMKAAYENSNVKAIIIRADSPGGSPVLSNTAYSEIRRLREEHSDIPVYAVAGDVCASGCYFIAAAADKIYADPSSLVGSIGVIGSSFDATGLMDKLGIKRRVRIAGSNKGMGDPFAPETPEHQRIWQQMLDQIHAEFIQSVKQGRGKRLNEQHYPDLFSGRVFTGIEAKKAGLIDDFGNIYSVSRDIVQAPELIDYTPEDTGFNALFNRRFAMEIRKQISEHSAKIW